MCHKAGIILYRSNPSPRAPPAETTLATATGRRWATSGDLFHRGPCRGNGPIDVLRRVRRREEPRFELRWRRIDPASEQSPEELGVLLRVRARCRRVIAHRPV